MPIHFIYVSIRTLHYRGKIVTNTGRTNERLSQLPPYFRTHKLTGNREAVNSDIGVYSNLSLQTVLKIIAFLIKE